jgi:hypothetical protein
VDKGDQLCAGLDTTLQPYIEAGRAEVIEYGVYVECFTACVHTADHHREGLVDSLATPVLGLVE